MNTSVQDFFAEIKGKRVAFIGIGTSNLPLIAQFAGKGAQVIACDRKSFEELGENGVKARGCGAELKLGENDELPAMDGVGQKAGMVELPAQTCTFLVL